MLDLVAVGVSAMKLAATARAKRRSPRWGLSALALGLGGEWAFGLGALALFGGEIGPLLLAMLVGLAVGLLAAAALVARLAEGPSDRLPQARVVSR
ncbi:MAG: hypothetical protein KF773_37560 [Deltaproteobacteria bacterium]|nr:hypothetical protein [Deltaproteobacteria bacterium]